MQGRNESRRRAVIVGINEYPAESGFSPLKFAVNDARALHNVLTNPTMGHFPEENVTLLLDEDATMANLREAFGRLSHPKADVDELVIVFVAAHGSPDSSGMDPRVRYIVPIDGRFDTLEMSAWSMSDFAEVCGGIHARHVAIFLDTCYSGAAATSFADIQLREVQRGFAPLMKDSRAVLAACHWERDVVESADLQHGVFSYHLIEGLKGEADLDEDGQVTHNDLQCAHSFPRPVRESGRNKEAPADPQDPPDSGKCLHGTRRNQGRSVQGS